ncbi:MAG TPA: hypothetical protein VHW23_28040 [Kofleriaceae bacterium]|nr:hypothetical protein [Kofleriaceae bacterium]
MSTRITHDERPIEATESAVKRVSDRHQIAVAAQDQRRMVRRSRPDRAERQVDALDAVAAPSQQSSEEAAQHDRVHALRDQGDAAEHDLEARLQQDLGTPGTIDPDAILAALVAKQPLALHPDQARMQARYAA